MADQPNQDRILDCDRPEVIAAEMEGYADAGQAPDDQVLRYWAQVLRDLATKDNDG